MCVAIAKPIGAELPSREILKICFRNNPDGAGFAFNRDGKNYIHKGYFTFGDFWRAFTSCNIKKEEGALIHFRVATHGGVSKGTCHPFCVCDDFETMRMPHASYTGDVMIHNGMLNFPITEQQVSDSMIMSKTLFSMDRHEGHNSFFIEMALINNDTSRMNRVAVLSTNGVIELYGHKEPWEKVEGCFYSNKSYQMGFSRGTVYTYVNNDKQNEKYNYNEEECVSNKINLCCDRKDSKNCDEIATINVYYTDDYYESFCDKCFNKQDVSYCTFCHKYRLNSYFTKKKTICDCCIENNEEFYYMIPCMCCDSEHSYKKVVYNTDSNKNDMYVHICRNCYNDYNVFRCDDCGKHYTVDYLAENYNNLCKKCFDKLTAYQKDCTYCKAKTDLYKTSYSSCCSKCLDTKEANRCLKCNKITFYTNQKFGKYGICTTCNTNLVHVLNLFVCFNVLKDEEKKEIIEKFTKANQDVKNKIIEMYVEDKSLFRYKEYKERALKLLEDKKETKVIVESNRLLEGCK